jgi:5S rRNA maturation endonuclease (ribonuclease M5)
MPRPNGRGTVTPASRIVATYDYVDEKGELHYQVVRKEPKAFLQRRPNGADGWHWGRGEARRVLYQVPEVIAAVLADDPVWIVEGEKDAEALRDLDQVATCNSEGAGKWRDEFADAFRDARDVRIIADDDAPGRAHARDIDGSLRKVGANARLFLAAEGCNDVSEHLAAGHALEDLREWRGEDEPQQSVVVVRLDGVRPEVVEWVWPGRLPRGKITIFDGDPGLSKSTTSLDLAARVSTGREMPDGSPGVEGGVVILSAEDGLADTIVPRLRAAGADLSRIRALTAIRTEHGERFPELPHDLDHLEDVVREVGAALVIVDPLMAYLGGDVNSHRDQDVRRALAPLAAVAERTRAAVLIIRHLNKAAGASPLYRGGGSIGIIGAARVGLLLARDPDDEDKRVLAVSKCNLAREAPALRFEIQETPDGAPRIRWLGTCEHSPASLLASPSAAEGDGRLDEAKHFLSVELEAGRVNAREIYKAAREAGISERTLKRAKADLRVESVKGDFGGGWFWEAPKRANEVNA